ncbi:hypothetical protein ACLKA6_017310 [Drosophila palustris]
MKKLNGKLKPILRDFFRPLQKRHRRLKDRWTRCIKLEGILCQVVENREDWMIPIGANYVDHDADGTSGTSSRECRGRLHWLRQRSHRAPAHKVEQHADTANRHLKGARGGASYHAKTCGHTCSSSTKVCHGSGTAGSSRREP